MKFKAIFVIFIVFAAAISSVKASVENGDDDGNSMPAWARQLFQKFAQLELKVDKILEQQNSMTECFSDRATERVEGGNPAEFNSADTGPQGSMTAQLNASSAQVDRLETILSQRT